LKERKTLDDLIVEVLSFRSYKKGKKPLGKLDPRDRIRKAVWTDEGVDLNLLEKTGPKMPPPLLSSNIFKTKEIEVKEGLFRKRRSHICLMDLSGIDILERKIRSIMDGKFEDGAQEICRSELLFPLVLSKAMDGVRQNLSEVKVERPVQKDPHDVSPRIAISHLLQGKTSVSDDDDLRRSFERVVDERFSVRTRNSVVINDLRSMITYVIGASDKDLSVLIKDEALITLARDGMRSTRLEGMLMDLTRGVDGGFETPVNFRERFCRMLMESEVSADMFEKVTAPLLERFRSCSKREASRLHDEVAPLMDIRSSDALKDLVYSVPASNRTFIIDLMGRTRDRNLSVTLNRIKDFSSLDEDRQAAEMALISLGG